LRKSGCRPRCCFVFIVWCWLLSSILSVTLSTLFSFIIISIFSLCFTPFVCLCKPGPIKCQVLKYSQNPLLMGRFRDGRVSPDVSVQDKGGNRILQNT
jgi:hypothetical protein